jgi:hypothetical protein
MANIYNNFDDTAVSKIQTAVENHSKTINHIVADIIEPYCRDLDKYVNFVKDCLKNGERPVSNQELEDFCMNLSTYIYFASGFVETLGIKDDISKALWKEMYHTTRNNTINGTVADKDSIAELASQQEQLTNICYNRAYKIMKAKVDSAQEVLQSAKKVLSHRMQEMELTKLGN